MSDEYKDRYNISASLMTPPRYYSQIQALSRSLVAKSSRSSDRCLLHWRPPCGALDRFLGRLYSTYSSGPIILLLFGRRGHRQISTVTRIQAHPCGFLHWAKNQDGECSSPDTADHPSDTPRLLLLPYLVRQIFGHDRRKHTTIEKQENRQSTEDKTKKQRVGRR